MKRFFAYVISRQRVCIGAQTKMRSNNYVTANMRQNTCVKRMKPLRVREKRRHLCSWKRDAGCCDVKKKMDWKEFSYLGLKKILDAHFTFVPRT